MLCWQIYKPAIGVASRGSDTRVISESMPIVCNPVN